MDDDFDIIVIGGGAGGGTLAASCAAAGKRILLVERGDNSTSDGSANGGKHGHDEHQTLIAKRPYDDRSIEVNGTAARLYMGGVLGGGTAVYGGALVRPHAADFSPGRYYGDRIPREIRDWPIGFHSFETYLAAAERLYRVADVPANRTVSSSGVMSCAAGGASSVDTFPGLPLAKINRKLMQVAASSGLNPWRLPLAIDAAKCLRCDHCAGFVCPTGARRSSAQLVSESRVRGESLTVMHNSEAERFERGRIGRLNGVWIRDRADGATRLVRAKRYVLSAGAIGSAAILLKSGFDHPLIGRNFMMHYSPLAIGLFARSTESSRTFVKQVGLSDFYYGTHELPEKMGIVQSLPAPGPLMMAKSGMKRVPQWVLSFLRARMLPLAGIVEDLPNPENRVCVSPSGAIRLHHAYSDYDHSRGSELTREMKKLLKAMGAFYSVSGKIASHEHVAHQCGTLRFGTSRNHAVADPDCRLYDQSEIFIADGSFMPTSLGVGPSLTIIGNAIRVSEIVAAEV
jgi:choline dehydrogenase-like flavoprotein